MSIAKLYKGNLQQKALKILRRYGSNSHLWVPGIGDYSDSGLLTPAVVDGSVGSVRDTFGGVTASQTTASYAPALRRGVVNYAPNSNFAGVVAGTPGTAPTGWSIYSGGGQNVGVVGSGTTADSIPYVDVRFWGTAGSTIYPLFAIASANYITGCAVGEKFAFSMDVALLSSTGTVTPTPYIPIVEHNSAGAYLSNSNTYCSNLSSTLTRYSVTRTLSNASVAKVSVAIQCTFTAGQSYDYTIRIARPQIERAATPSDEYVPTTTTNPASSSVGNMFWYFDTDDRMPLASIPFDPAGDFCILACVKTSGSTNYAHQIFRVEGSTATLTLYESITGTESVILDCKNDASSTTLTHGPTGRVNGNKYVVRASVVNRLGTVTINGVAGTSTTTPSGPYSTVTGASIGRDGTDSLRGNLYALCAIKGTVSDADLKILERWIGNFGGVALV